METLLRALAEPRRQEILQLVADRELASGEIAAHFDVSRPAISQHLQVLKAAGDTETPQGILAVLPIRSLPLPPAPDFTLILDEMRDPGNLGTILRTACAAGVQAVLLSPGSADLYAPKVVRSAMGAHFRLPVHALDWPAIHSYLTSEGSERSLLRYLADSQKGQPYYQADFGSPLALIVGGEAEGAGREARELATGPVHIPMPGKAESLNAAAAAAVLLFEVVRQRKLDS